MTRTWWRDPSADLIKVRFDDVTAVFDTDSGQTHILNPLPALILDQLGDTRLSLDALISTLLGSATAGIESEARNQITAALHFLEEAELIQSRGRDEP